MAEKWLVGGSGQEAGHGRTSMMPRTSGRIQPRQLIAALAFLTVATMLTGCGETPAPAPAPAIPVVTPTPTPTPTVTPTPTPTVAPVVSTCVTTPVDGIATNGDFESGSQGWITGDDSKVLQGTAAKFGTGYVQLGGPTTSTFEATRSSWITAPTVALAPQPWSWWSTSLSIEFDAKISTTETDGAGHDQFSVLVNDQNGPHLVQALSNLSATPGYVHYSFDVTAFRGETVAVTFILVQDAVNPTTVLLDNVTETTNTAPAAVAGPGTGQTDVDLTSLMNSGAVITETSIQTTKVAGTSKQKQDFRLLDADTTKSSFMPEGSIFLQTMSLGLLGCGTLLYTAFKPTGSLWTAPTTYGGIDAGNLLKLAVNYVLEASAKRVEPRTRYMAEFNAGIDPKNIKSTTDTLLTGYATIEQKIGVPYYYRNIGGFAADMTAYQASQLDIGRRYATNNLSSLVPDAPETLNDEPWPSPLGTPGVSVRGETVMSTPFNANLTHLTSRVWTSASNYSPLNQGAGVDAYVLDTGLDIGAVSAATGNPLFNNATTGASRVTNAFSVQMSAVDPNAEDVPFLGGLVVTNMGSEVYNTNGYVFEDSNPAPQLANMSDSNPDKHGTQMAAALGGTAVGVSPAVNLIPIKVQDSSHPVTEASVAVGVEWAVRQELDKRERLAVGATPDPAVLNDSLNHLARDLVFTPEEQGLVMMGAYGAVTVAAGNDNADACLDEPGNLGQTEAGITTVGQVDEKNKRLDSYGNCINIFAPGYMPQISSTKRLNGTSIASAVTAGAAAQLESLQPTLTGADAKALLLQRATTGVINFINNTDPVQQNSEDGLYVEPAADSATYQAVFQGQSALSNKLLYIGSQCSSTSSPESQNGTGWSIPVQGKTLVLAMGSPEQVSNPVQDPACRKLGRPLGARTLRFSVSYPSGDYLPLTEYNHGGTPAVAWGTIDLVGQDGVIIGSKNLPTDKRVGSIRVIVPLTELMALPVEAGQWWRLTVHTQDNTTPIAVSRWSITSDQ